jgi:hypothetical protein
MDPILGVLNRGGGLLAAQIAGRVYPGDEADRAVLTGILSRVFRGANNMLWPAFRRTLLRNVNQAVLSRLGRERTEALYGEIETQINRVARQHDIDTQPGWLTIGEQQAADSVPEHLREDAIRNAPMEETPEQQEVRRRHRAHYFPGKSFLNLPWLEDVVEMPLAV